MPGALRQEEVPLRKIPADIQRDSLSRGSIKVTDREGLWLSLENDFKIKGKRAGREEFPRARCERQARDGVSTRGNSGAEQGSWWDYRRQAGRKNREGLKGRHRRRAQKEGDSFGVSLLGPGEYPRPSSHSSQAGDFLFTPHLRAHAKSHQLLTVPHLVYSILTHTARSG